MATAGPSAKVARALKVLSACACVSERDVSSEQNRGHRRREEAGTGQRSSSCWSRKAALVGSSGRKGKYMGRSPKCRAKGSLFGASGFCYEAGASVEVAPEEALGSGGWGEKKKTPKAQHAGWCSAAVFEAADVGRSA